MEGQSAKVQGYFPLCGKLRVWLAKPGDRKALPLKPQSRI